MSPDGLSGTKVTSGAAVTQTPSETAPSRQALLDARQNFYALPAEDAFRDIRAERGIADNATGDPRYWAAAADYAFAKADEARARGVPEKAIVLGEISAATPDFLYTQRYLDRHSHDAAERNSARYHLAKETVSYFNGLIRRAASEWPDMKPSDLHRHLLDIAANCIEGGRLRHAAAGHLASAIRGAQHELAFGQLLARTGRPFREASVDEDLHGIDYDVDNPDGSAQYIDVKASLNDIRKRRTARYLGHHALYHHRYGYHGPHDYRSADAATGRPQVSEDAPDDLDSEAGLPYTRTRDGHLVMYSMIRDQELGDSFRVPDKLAAERGAYLRQLLQDAETDNQGARLPIRMRRAA